MLGLYSLVCELVGAYCLCLLCLFLVGLLGVCIADSGSIACFCYVWVLTWIAWGRWFTVICASVALVLVMVVWVCFLVGFDWFGSCLVGVWGCLRCWVGFNSVG